VTRFHAGDEVFGIGRRSFAEFVAAREDKLAHKPAGLSFEQAAVVPVSALTAIQGLRDAERVEAGQKVLIIGASGGVGTYATLRSPPPSASTMYSPADLEPARKKAMREPSGDQASAVHAPASPPTS